jgi:hypothetical protein
MAGFAAAKILEDILGAYFEDMDDFMLNIFEGHILLQNIEVRAGAIQNALGLPLEVKVGTIGRVELRIPWAKLNSEPTQLLLDDLFIICGPQSESVWVDDVEAERAFQKKQAALASRERQPVPVESQAKETFQTKLTQAVLGRLEVRHHRTLYATPLQPLHSSLQQPAPSSLQQPAPDYGVSAAHAGAREQRAPPVRRQQPRRGPVLHHAAHTLAAPAQRRRAGRSARGACRTRAVAARRPGGGQGGGGRRG